MKGRGEGRQSVFVHTCVSVCGGGSVSVCLYMCVRERDREREKKEKEGEKGGVVCERIMCIYV